MNENRKCIHYDPDNEICRGCIGRLYKEQEPRDWCPYCHGDGVVEAYVDGEWAVVSLCPYHAQELKSRVNSFVHRGNKKDPEVKLAESAVRSGRIHLQLHNDWNHTAYQHDIPICWPKRYLAFLEEYVSSKTNS